MSKANTMPEYFGPFKELLPEYINFKRAQGYAWQPPITYRLKEMDTFFHQMGIAEIVITRKMYESYTAAKPGEKETTTQKRQAALRGFANYLIMRGYENIYNGYDDTRIFKRDFIPYVFSEDEISRIFRILLDWRLNHPCYENDAFSAIMSLYCCCGLRKSEAQNLLLRDVDIQTGKITILGGKNDVSRINVVSDSLLRQLHEYHGKHRASAMPDDYFFRGIKSKKCNDDFIYKKFRKLLSEAGILPRAGGDRQRIHDLRHTFCVRALEQMQKKGFDLYTSLPLLSIHLGHKHITETEYYLRMLDEHFDGILQKSADYIPDLYGVPRAGGA
jgi:integrase